MPITALLQNYRSGETTCSQETEKHLQVIAEKDADLGAFLTDGLGRGPQRSCRMAGLDNGFAGRG